MICLTPKPVPEATYAEESLIRTDTVVIGAGPAGLAVAACLQREGVSCIILERAEAVGSRWRAHYDRLHLHTDKKRSALPHLPFPDAYPTYPSRQHVVEYLEAYAEHFGLAPHLGEEVEAVRRDGEGWETVTRRGRYRSRRVVVATGHANEPRVPDWPGREDFAGPVLHSAAYRSGEPFRGQDVLVVGIGNSGAEIALDLAEHDARPTLAFRTPTNIVPRDLLGVPLLAISRLSMKLPPAWADRLNAPLLRAVFGDLTRYGLPRPPYGPMTQIRRERRVPLIDVGTVAAIKRGEVAVKHAGIERFTEGGVAFDDGIEQGFDAVVLATGYRPAVDAFLEEEVTTDASGFAELVMDLPSGIPAGHIITATATAPDGSTSEFSNGIVMPVSAEDDAVPTVFALHAPYPNPLRTRATLRYDLAEAAPVRLVLFDVLGRAVAVLDEAERPAGRYEVALDAGDLPSGVYVVRIEAGGFRAAQKLVRVR